MTEPTEKQVHEALRAAEADGHDLAAVGARPSVTIRDGNVQVAIEIAAERTAERARALEPLRRAAERAVAALPGVVSATVVLTAERAAAPRRGPPAGGAGITPLPGIRAVIAVASGKGGVGKSTVAVNLAVALAEGGLSIGLLDADVYGPSTPRMMGVKGRPESRDGKRLEPMEAHGVRCMSIGFLVEEETPMIWRGPMVMSALQQMLGDVNWGELDVLVLDMPPGTGDAQLTVAQRVPLAGAVIVSTPQDIALLDARKGLNMFRKVDVPVLGIVENMSFYVCPSCGHESHVFGHGGARAEAERLGCDFLGEVPLELRIRETGDQGVPIVRAEPASPHAQAFREIAGRVRQKVEERLTGKVRPPPRIVMAD